MTPEKQTINLSSYQAAYIQSGEGKPLLMLHGFMGNSSNWQNLISQLQSNYNCIALDLLGFGASSQPSIKYNIDLEVEFTQQFLQQLNISSCSVIGHSFGGWVAAALAIKYPQIVDQLFLVAPAGIRDDQFSDRYHYLKPLLWDTPIIDWGIGVLTPVAQIIGKNKSITQIKFWRNQLLLQPVARSFLLDRMRPEDAVDTVEKHLDQVKASTLIVAGEHDETIPLWHCQTYAERITQAQLKIIPKAGHNLPQAHANEIARLILAQDN